MASTVLGTSMTLPSAQLAVSSSPFSQMMIGLPSLEKGDFPGISHQGHSA